ncbi:branched-chain amino acid transport ATP-binding protein LivF [Sulfuriferula multivorans]|uniref:Branched-chain amino acid transport ATP-binding protein LivF n=1 Tax=Sulfuriferula multivorans TaxID=1559896 RepID=A0A401K0D0_9PROT|nr:ABC transporter ATP-binding protein [Sulfuriferula multivorans]GCB02357.1 branched-chain amino acid transport ATP-binding protein LivF [Sulfuriferula multivorans]
MSLLFVENLAVSYGNIKAVRGVSLKVDEGERVCLIGANGAGKTTLLKAIVGMLPPAKGSVHFAGQSITHKPSFQIVRLGLAMVPEGRGIFSRLTVAENLAMGAYARRDDAAVRQETDAMYQRFERLGERRNQPAGQLSGGEQQMLAIGRALLSRPRLLLLDEPSMGLAPMMVEKIFDTLRDIAARGVSIFLVEQNARLALESCDRGYIMASGNITGAGTAATLIDDPAVQEAYFGA